RGVAVVVIPGDVARQEVESAELSLPAQHTPPSVCPAVTDLHLAAEMLNGAHKITILGGAGCAEAHNEVIQLANILKAPIVHALRGKEYLEHDNPFDVGMTGLLGFSSGYQAMMDCDVLLMLGTDLPYQQFYPSDARVIQVDLRPENIGRRVRVHLGLVGDVGATLRGLSTWLQTKENREHLDASLEHYREARKSLDDLATGTPGRKPIHPEFVARTLSELAAPNAIFTCDVGTPTIWASRYLKMNGWRRLLGSFNHGSMANALPQAIGAQLAFPNRQVISMSGDGGFAMLMGDVLTLKQLKLPVKIVIFNNSSLGFVEMEMKAAGLLEFGTELQNPNFATMAESIGIRGFRIEDPADVASGLREALNCGGPALVDAVVNRQELSMPPHIEMEQAKGFSLFILKAILNGRGDEIVDLVRTNVLR
ncbi:MAG TPA: thiamine pyrophosphate-dependent enzyme, partial [Verrucomicrobiae bacterium]|nr:thiamine pyrophosphate-dependent enzyme [Verrucomicrobiae bacterium]